MKAHFTVQGADDVIRELNKMAGIEDEVDKLTENSMKRIQLSAFRKAPVLTGFLSSNLAADENRKRSEGSEKGSWDLIDGTEYTLVQEFTHRSKSHFIRDSVWDEEPKMNRELRNLVKKGKW